MKNLLLLAILCISANFASAVNVEELKIDLTDRALFVKQAEVPTFNMMISFKAGSVFENNYAHGTANLLANLIAAGTDTQTAQQIQEDLDELASQIYIYSSRDEIKVEVKSLIENVEPTMNILQNILTKAAFPEREFNILKSSIAQAIKQQKQSPMFLATYQARKEFYGEDNIKAFVSNLGTQKSLDTISIQTVKDYYKEYITKENMSISVVSSLEKSAVETLLDTYLKDMTKGDRKQLIAPVPVNETNRAVIHRELPQTTVLLYSEGISRTNKNYYTSVLFNYVLGGGGFNSRLMEEIREKRGLTYGVRSSFEYDLPYDGLYTITLQTANKNKHLAEKLIRAELKKMLDSGITVKELENAKSFLVGSFPITLRTSDKLLSYLNTIQKFNLDLNYLNVWTDSISKVTLEQVNSFAKQMIKNDVSYSRVFVGGIKK